MSHANDTFSLLKTMGLDVALADINSQAAAAIEVHTPIDGSRLARIAVTSRQKLMRRLNAPISDF